jgi:hypothetical protein
MPELYRVSDFWLLLFSLFALFYVPSYLNYTQLRLFPFNVLSIELPI